MKTPNTITAKKKVSREITKPRHIPDAYTWNLVPVMDNAPQVWAQELRDWVKNNPHARTITEFLDSKELYRDTYYKIIDRFPVLKEAHKHAKLTLGERLWQAAVDNKANWKAVHHRLYSYDTQFENDDAYHAKLAREKNEGAVEALVSGIIHSNKDKIHESNK
jgi:hypothetical protein